MYAIRSYYAPSLLKQVAGLNETLAKNIVTFRETNGAFTGRKQLMKVPKMGPKAFEQCAGFLRVPESKLVLDNTGVHPESYAAAERLLSLTGYTRITSYNVCYTKLLRTKRPSHLLGLELLVGVKGKRVHALPGGQ